MKIGITCYPTYGGSGVVATELGLELARRDHEIHFISYSQPIRLTGPEPNIHYHEVEVTRYPLFEYPPYDLALATRMAEVSQLYELDLLHVHYAIPHSVSAMLAKQMLAANGGKRERIDMRASSSKGDKRRSRADTWPRLWFTLPESTERRNEGARIPNFEDPISRRLVSIHPGRGGLSGADENDRRRCRLLARGGILVSCLI